MEKDWASVPLDVLVKCVSCVEDYRAVEFSEGSGIWTVTLISMSSVCRSWRRILFHIRHLRPRCTSDDLAKIVFKFPSLRVLDLRRCRSSSDDSWEELSQGKVDDIPCMKLDPLCHLRHLKSLEVHHVGDEEVMIVCRLSQLSSLTLGGYPRMTGRGVQELTALQLLTALSFLSDGRLDPRSYRFLAELKALRSLCLHHCNVDDAGLEAVGKLTNLERLRLSSCRRIRGNGLAKLSQLCQLTDLDLSATKTTDDALYDLIKCSGIRVLNLSHCVLPLAHDRLRLLTVLPLTRLYLFRCEGVNYETVKELKWELEGCVVYYQRAGDALKDRTVIM